MIINFHSISHDFYGVVEQPTVVLKTPHGAIIAPIAAYNIRATFRYNDVSEIEFDVSAYTDGVKTAGYDEIAGFRQVSVGDFGDFIIANPEKTNEGGDKEVKHCTAYSLEYAFNFKQAELGEGTYNFYDPLDNTDTIMGMLIEAVPDWSIGEVDEALVGRWRTFDQVNDKWYSWLMGEVQESYNCLFQFDTKNKTVNALSAEHAAENLPIYLSYQNLLSSVNVRELSDEVVTALSGYGSGDDVDIRYVNPNGTDKIYNIDFFIARGDLPDDLAAKWITYRDTVAVEQKQYANAKTIYLDKFNQMMLAEAKLTALQTEYDSIDETLKTQQIALQSITEAASRSVIEDLIVALQQQLSVTGENLASAQIELDALTTAVDELDEAINAIIDQLKLSAYFTPEELEILSQYFIEDSITEDTFVLSEYGSVLSDDLNEVLTADNQVTVSVTDATLHATNKYSQVEDSTIDLDADLQAEIIAQLENEQNKRCIEMRSGVFYMSYRKPQDDGTYELVEIDGDIINVDLQYNLQNLTTYEDESSPDMTKRGYYIMTAELKDVLAGGGFYPSMHLTMSGMLGSDLPTVTDTSLDMTADTATYMATGSVTEAQKQHVLTELYEYTEDQLRKLSEPSYEFNIDTANFLFAREFAPFKDSLELGKTINLVIDKEEETLLKPILIEVQLDYSNLPSLELVFSNKFRASSNEFMLADIISDTARSSRSVDLNKASYSAYVDSKADSQVRKMKESAVDVTKNKIVNASNQNVEWNQSGLFLRKLNSNGEYEANQIGLINDSIAFTHDGWDSVDIAIGSFYDPNLADGTDSGLRYGIAAPAIYGTLIAGENLVIENTVLSQDGTSVLKQFKVDSTGVWVNNASLAFASDNGGKILIDPEYGLAAGNSNLFTVNGTTVIPSFVDEYGNIIYDSSSTVTRPDGTYYYAPKNTKFYFNIKTGDAYFSGDINAQNVIAGTLSGTVINDATVSAAKIAISDLAELRADVAGIHMQLNALSGGSIYSGNKSSLDSANQGFFMDSYGQMCMGTNNAYIKSYLDGNSWKIDIVADEINLAGTGDIGTAINSASAAAAIASRTATQYITTIAQNGIFVHTAASSTPSDNTAYGVNISDSVDIIRGGVTVASYGTDIELKPNGNTKVKIASSGHAYFTGTIHTQEPIEFGSNAGSTFAVTNTSVKVTLNANGNGSRTNKSIKKANYYPVGIVGWNTLSGNPAWTFVHDCRIMGRKIGECTPYIAVRDASSSPAGSCNVSVRILWVYCGTGFNITDVATDDDPI